MMLLKTSFHFDSLFCPDYQLYLRLFPLKTIRVVAGAIKVVCFFVQSNEEEREVQRKIDCFSKRARNFLFGSL